MNGNDGSRNGRIRGMIRWNLLLLILAGFGTAGAQLQQYNHPELEWRTIETDHFYIHFHLGAERTARLTARIAEEIYGPVTELYAYEPDGKIHFIVRDHDDDANGAAFYYDNKVEILAPSMDFPLRGTHDWLRNVISHELAHMISMGAARKMTRRIPAVYFQWFGYEKESRPDVIHGYPNTLVSMPFAGTVLPPWFAEGMAQIQRVGFDYDRWDSHRDMVLRMAVLNEELLTLREMEEFEKTSLGRERVYNQGYGLTLYIAQEYGEDALQRLVGAVKRLGRMSFNGAVKEVLGISQDALYEAWKAWLSEGYARAMERIRSHRTDNRLIEGMGEANFHPMVSPDGRYVAYLSNRHRDYMGQTSLYVLDLESGERRKVMKKVETAIGWSPDGKKLVYAKSEYKKFRGSHYYDLFTYEIETRKETRLTHGMRARSPHWTRDGRIVCVVEIDGSSNLYVGSETGRFEPITTFEDGEQIFTPRWMENGSIVFAVGIDRHGRDIAVIDSDGQNFRYLVNTESDERDPFPAGKSIYYSSDATGIFNVYRLDASSGSVAQITNVPGGAFMPSVAGDGRLVFSVFRSDGYKIALSYPEVVGQGETDYATPYESIREAGEASYPASDYDDTEIPEYPSRPYRSIHSGLSFFPRAMMDYPQQLKIGTYFYGSDFLDRVSLLGGFAVNGQADIDLAGIFEYKRLLPTLFLEAYHQVRHTSDEGVDVRFNLTEVDLGADWRVDDYNVLRTAFVFSRYDARMEFQDQGQLIKFDYTYHIGNVFQLQWTHSGVKPSVFSGIAPVRGRSITLRAERAYQRFLDDFVVHPKYGTIVETFTHYDYDQVELDWREYVPSFLKDHSLALRVRAGFIDRPVDDFYHLFAGGLEGLKGYPYYSLEGRKLAVAGAAYRFPIVRDLNLRLGFLTFKQLFGSVYGQVGNAWQGAEATGEDWKRTLGGQLRTRFVAFYTFPMSLFLDAAYGLDRFEHKEQAYGREWRFYFGVLFDFID